MRGDSILSRLRRRFGRHSRVVDPSEYPRAYFDVDAHYYYYGHHKCATNWMRSFLRGLCRERGFNYLVYRGDNRTNAFSPAHRASFHLYVNSWAKDMKRMAEGGRGFHLIRDPRDALVSTYYSWRYSHRLADEKQRRIRRDLERLGPEEGLLYTLDHFYYHDEIATWELGCDPRVLDVRYEDLVADEVGSFRRILAHLGLEVADARLHALVAAASFERLSGRRRGDERARSHFRKGVAGDWKNHFGDDGPLKTAVYDKLEPLILRLGYEL